ncbi:MAG: helix-turn-helix domain-containing protein [Candidatus Helarchaeota archaeon]|nr:helix-turn-helix domain-containing protein [Candidatus Helarchaeota archaeon]
MADEIMTIDECAKYLKTSLSTLYKLAQEGKMPAFKLSGQWRFKKDLIDKWMEDESLRRNRLEEKKMS